MFNSRLRVFLLFPFNCSSSVKEVPFSSEVCNQWTVLYVWPNCIFIKTVDKQIGLPMCSERTVSWHVF